MCVRARIPTFCSGEEGHQAGDSTVLSSSLETASSLATEESFPATMSQHLREHVNVFPGVAHTREAGAAGIPAPPRAKQTSKRHRLSGLFTGIAAWDAIILSCPNYREKKAGGSPGFGIPRSGRRFAVSLSPSESPRGAVLYSSPWLWAR